LSDGFDRVHVAMERHVDRGEIPGVVTLRSHNGDIRVDAIGTIAFNNDTPICRDTIFRIASLTKPIGGAAAMMLVEEGKISLEEPVDRLLPELAARRVLKRLDGPLDETVPATLLAQPPDWRGRGVRSGRTRKSLRASAWLCLAGRWPRFDR
jgi:CubicO group peptidase (beta-lactamase class C family)